MADLNPAASKKSLLIAVAAVVILILIFTVYWFGLRRPETPAATSLQNAIDATTGALPEINPLSNPVGENLPELNPVEEANPFIDIYKNPFE